MTALRPATQTSFGGIDCESCHGPAQQWLSLHYQHGIDRERLRSLGMTDTKNILVRSRLCTACHIGDESRDVNHDLLAAGHPPLRFELSAYHDKITRKHWSDAERIDTPHFKALLWAAGQFAAADASLALLESRAKRAAAGDKYTPWPEFAEYDCFACHQRLRPAGVVSGVPLAAVRTGVPSWQPWNLALAERLLPGDAGIATAELRRYMNRSLVNEASAAQHLAAAARKQIELHPRRSVQAGAFQTLALLEVLGDFPGGETSWAEQVQQLLALKAAYLATRDEARRLDSAVRPASSSVVRGNDDRQLAARLGAVAQSLSFPAPQFEWPAYDWAGLPADARIGTTPHADARAISTELRSIARELRRRAGTARSESF
jgi:hypothetical protein